MVGCKIANINDKHDRWFWLDTHQQDANLPAKIVVEGGARLPPWVICGETESSVPVGTWICADCARREGLLW